MADDRIWDTECALRDTAMIERELSYLVQLSVELAQQHRNVLDEAERLVAVLEAAAQLRAAAGGPAPDPWAGGGALH